MDSKIFNGISVFMALLGSFIGWFLGGIDGFLYTLIACIIIDYVTGLMVAIVFKEISSKIGFKGIFRKFFMFAIVGMASLIDRYIIGTGSAIRGLVILFYISNEGISIVENATKMDLPIPEKLKSILKQINRDNKKK